MLRRGAGVDSRQGWVKAQVVLEAAVAAVVCGAAVDCVSHDLSDGSRAAAALGAAAQADIDFSDARRRLQVDYAAHILVGDYVARADDHGLSE
jgi:hypothetical protein